MRRLIPFFVGILVILVIGVIVAAHEPVPMNDQKAVVQTKRPDIPHDITYIGYLEDADGNPITDTLSMEFRIYDAETGGSELWHDSYSVSVINGRFNVILYGIPSDVFTDGAERWLEVKIGDETLSPRTKLTSVGWSYVAEQADNAAKWSGHTWGDLYPNANATQIQGNAVSSETPEEGEILKWNGTQWSPAADVMGGKILYCATKEDAYWPVPSEWTIVCQGWAGEARITMYLPDTSIVLIQWYGNFDFLRLGYGWEQRFVETRILIDGVYEDFTHLISGGYLYEDADLYTNVPIMMIKELPPGSHTVQVEARRSALGSGEEIELRMHRLSVVAFKK